MGTATLEQDVAGKKKNGSAKRPDQHVSNFMVRLPEVYRDLLTQIKAKTGRSMATSTAIALEREAVRLGIPFTPNWPDAQ